jgi:hypothetical protein
MSLWFTTPKNLPVDGSEVWVRLNYWFGQPFKAVWSLANQEFTSSDNSMVYPVWSISRWRNL